MDKFRRRSTAEESFGRLERALSGLSVYRKGSVGSGSTVTDSNFSDEHEDFKGPLGLNLLHTVPEPLVDLIFIHGLGGGSRKTWSKTKDPYYYWPKEWISRDPEFGSVRVHSFGYKADWAERQGSLLNFHDFSLSLLGEIQCNPDIRRSNTKIVLVAHSMGGIITKKAYILAREDPALKEIAGRIHTLYFLATPHRGADLAKTLLNILRVSFSHKPFVAELERNSDSIQSINDSFRHFSEDVQLWSFYETLPCSLPLGNAIIVDKSSATLGLAKERCSLLNADHRAICKFDSPKDPNYKTLRNAFITTVDSILNEASQQVSEATKLEHSKLIELTGVSEPPIDDLVMLEEIRVPGSCEWLNSKDQYTTWKSAWSHYKPIFWLTGDAGSGKSVLSSYVVNDLEDINLKCSYFYFKQGNANKSSIARCLLSLAMQMAQSDERMLARMTALFRGSDGWEQLDERTLWRKVFLGCVFKEPNPEPRYWIIDGLDECRRLPVLLSLLAQAPNYLRIFLTSRNTPEVHQCLASHDSTIEHYPVQVEDTLIDLGIFVDSRIHSLPVGTDGSREKLRCKILEKASGSFMWTALVVRELEGVYSEEGAEEVLNEVPPDMNDLYARMLQNIPPKGHRLARSVISWTLLAMRSLSLDEMKDAIKMDTNETVPNLSKAIMAICGQLIGVDQHSHVQSIHQTAKVFLLSQDKVPALMLRKQKCHSRIAELCLASLNAKFGQKVRQRKSKSAPIDTSSTTDITNYAALHFSDHLQRCTSEDQRIKNLLSDFLENNVLSWVEYLAKEGKLQHITRTAKNLKSYLLRRLKYIQPFSNEKENLETWIYDLIRLNGKFRTMIATCPSTIHYVVPALCPSESMISKIYSSRPRGIIMKGVNDKTWDECLTRIDYQSVQTSAVAHGDRYLAVALADGRVILYPHDSTEAHATFSHGERAKILIFSTDDSYLASSSLHKVRVWDVQSRTELWTFDVQYQPLTLGFANDNTVLVAATQGNYTITWDLEEEQMENETWSWIHSFQELTGQIRPAQPPGKALLSEDCSLLAVSYRGKPIYLFDTKNESLVGSCSRNSTKAPGQQYAVDALAFNPNPEINVLVASYGDGELVVYDLWTAELQYQTQDVYAHTLSCSPDGRMLVTGSSQGTIFIFEFSGAQGTNLTLTYRINAYEDGIRGIAFSSDSLRFTDIRGSQCRIWEPAVLISNDYDEGSQSELSQAVMLKPKSVAMLEGPSAPEITAMCPDSNGNYLFCGRQDGVVTYFDVRSATDKAILYQHTRNISITCIAFCEGRGLLITADESSRVIVAEVQGTSAGYEVLSTVCEIRTEEPVLGLLSNTDGTKLLVQGRHAGEVWTMQGVRTGFKIALPQHQSGYTVLNDRLNPKSFMIIADDVSVYPWGDALDTIHEADVSTLCTPKDLVSSSRKPNQYLAVLGSTHGSCHESSCQRLIIWESAKISQTPSEINELTLPGFNDIPIKVKQIIAVTGSLVLFLDNDLWVGSVDITRWIAEQQGAQRHFFLLPEWQGSSKKFFIEYLPSRREFMVVRKHEVLVIRRGLDVATPLS